MGTGENKLKGKENLAEDIAHLYSLENVEQVPYRTFPRRPLPEQRPAALTEVDQHSPLPPAVAAPQESVAAAPPPPVLEPPENIAVPEVISTPPPAVSPAEPPTTSTAIAIYSLAGGVGKTTIAANLGRILCSLGEEVVLVDTSGTGLLPFYFGASDLRPGLRTFVAPGGNYAPMHVLETEEVTEEWLDVDVAKAMQLGQRTIFDLGPASTTLLHKIFSLCSVVLVPLLSDLNSFLTVPRIESSIATMRSKGIKTPLPLYLFNKVDANSLMDQEARNLSIRQIGDRLLPVSIRRSPDIPSAIADRMTVADHAPASAVSHDFMELAIKLRELAPIRVATAFHGRWRER